jgi:hypothetical protein
MISEGTYEKKCKNIRKTIVTAGSIDEIEQMDKEKTKERRTRKVLV